MTEALITLSPADDITTAARVLLDNNINGAPVVDDGGLLVGIICQSDLITQQKRVPIPSVFTLLDGIVPLSSAKALEKEVRKIAATTVKEAMTPRPVTLQPGDSVEEAATLMVDKGFHTLPVVDDGRLVGVVGKKDVLRTILGG